MTDVLATCREALKDNAHPLHQAVWLLFGQRLNVKTADRLLGNQKETVIPLCLNILDTDALYDEASLGSGVAPIHSIEVLGHWKVDEAIPRLLRIIDKEDPLTIVYDRALVALGRMGQPVVDIFCQRLEQTGDNQAKITYASILSEAGRGDPKVFELLKTILEQQKHPLDIEFMAENLLRCDSQAGLEALENLLRKRRYSAEARELIQARMQDAREGWIDL